MKNHTQLNLRNLILLFKIQKIVSISKYLIIKKNLYEYIKYF